MIDGDRGSSCNMIRADRADGVYLRNFTVEYSDFNNIYVLETNGFRFDRIVSRYSREYGILSFTSDHGIYENCETYDNGDSGVYPGSGPNARHGQPDAHGHVYGIIIRDCDSHDNTIGYSGTAGNGIWAHHNRFHDNSAGTTPTRSRPATPACRRTTRSGATTSSTRTTSTSSATSATPTARTRRGTSARPERWSARRSRCRSARAC